MNGRVAVLRNCCLAASSTGTPQVHIFTGRLPSVCRTWYSTFFIASLILYFNQYDNPTRWDRIFCQAHCACQAGLTRLINVILSAFGALRRMTSLDKTSVM